MKIPVPKTFQLVRNTEQCIANVTNSDSQNGISMLIQNFQSLNVLQPCGDMI